MTLSRDAVDDRAEHHRGQRGAPDTGARRTEDRSPSTGVRGSESRCLGRADAGPLGELTSAGASQPGHAPLDQRGGQSGEGHPAAAGPQNDGGKIGVAQGLDPARRSDTTRVRLLPDGALCCFYFVIEQKNSAGEWERLFNGGLLFHGAHDGLGSGSGPTFACTLTPTIGWSIHT